jgi:hypothetical protein
MAKHVIHFKIDGNNQFPVFLNGYPLSRALPDVPTCYIRSGQKYLAISIDDTYYHLPDTIVILNNPEDCLSFMSNAELVLPQEGIPKDWKGRLLTEEEKKIVVDYLFSQIG